MSVEMISIQHVNVYTVTDLPKGRKPIGSKWVFDVKRDVTGNIMRYKAHLDAKGFLKSKASTSKKYFLL